MPTLTSSGKKGPVRLTLLYTVGRTHRQESPGYRSNLPGNTWPATLPQFICKQITAPWIELFPQMPSNKSQPVRPDASRHSSKMVITITTTTSYWQAPGGSPKQQQSARDMLYDRDPVGAQRSEGKRKSSVNFNRIALRWERPKPE